MAKNGRSTGRAPGHRQNSSTAADRRQYNAAGAAKRIASRGNKSSALDVYEYTQAKNRRAAVRQDLDRDEEELGRGDADDLGDLRLPPKFKMPGEDEDGVIDSGDDEELDSDEAFEGESDEERFAHFTFESAQKKTSAAKKAQAGPKPSKKPSAPLINLDEDVDTFGGFDDDIEENAEEGEEEEEDTEDEEEGDFMDLSQMLDKESDGDNEDEDEGDEEDHDSILRNKGSTAGPEHEEEEEDEESGDDIEEEAEEVDEAEEDGDLAKLSTFIDTLSRKRKLDEAEAGPEPLERKSKRRVLPEAAAAGPENEFAVPSSVQQGRRKLQLQDLLAPLSQDAGAADLLSMQRSTKALTSSNSAPLAAPLPLRAQEKLDRQAAYEATKAEVQKWAPAMRRIRDAEHLSFPLQSEPIARETNASLVSSFKPSTNLESAVDRLLKTAELREQDVLKTEELELAHLSKEEVAARRAELRQMRDLMFRAEAKAKRVSKIKSKTYHRIQKRKNEKERRALEEAGLLPDEQDVGEEGSERRKELERDRALERATQRHKNTGKWARAMLSKGEMDVDVRREMNEQLERSEQLRRKILGHGQDSDESESEDDDDADEDAIRDRAFNELAALDGKDADMASGKRKGIMNMKFMQEAAAEDEQRLNKDRDDFVRELERLGADPDKMQQDDADIEEERQAFVLVDGNKGRRVFGPGPGAQPTTDEVPSRPIANSADFVTLPPSDDEASAPAPVADSGSNPWLSTDGSTKRTSKKNHALTKDSNAADKSQAVLKGQLSKTLERRRERQDEARVEISMGDLLKVDRPKDSRKNANGQKTLKQKKAEKAEEASKVATVDEAYHDDETEDEADMKNASAFTQRDLVAQAFAGDNVIEEFEEEKRREVEANAPREEDTTLPGWGSWGGKGTREPKKKFTKTVPGVLPTERADAGKKNVIINEKRDKRGGKYQLKDLPWPYTNTGQFERMVEQPLGSEWNTRTIHQRLTVPRVVTKMGTVIDPLEKMF
ncbi:Utp14-domain-containing protein [Calocera viscosa TUFC12733]|uniref:Utp14-domain-containing protein n=1 Tax=Calocera viscosa (strain TUFC12733) TaxID=1330018 RepID=A0A167LS03_CALVF|nr:Utp14-domain-containing protein [Calocera viscosa TUFC12733]